MFRIANLVMVVALLVTAAVVYQVKYSSTADAERLAHMRQAIRAERDAIAMLRAEWARRTSPLYVQGLVQRHLDLQPLSSDNISSLDDLPEKPTANGDGIGGMIEALVDAPLTTSTVTRPRRTQPCGRDRVRRLRPAGRLGLAQSQCAGGQARRQGAHRHARGPQCRPRRGLRRCRPPGRAAAGPVQSLRRLGRPPAAGNPARQHALTRPAR